METLQSNGLWHVTLVEDDLVEQAGLNREDFEQDWGHFNYKDRPVLVSHEFNNHLVVSMVGQEDNDLISLINAFSIVVGYRPFCKYNTIQNTKDGKVVLPTYEWDKIDPIGRFNELKRKRKKDLVTLKMDKPLSCYR
jgi:hypothetical protein